MHPTFVVHYHDSSAHFAEVVPLAFCCPFADPARFAADLVVALHSVADPADLHFDPGFDPDLVLTPDLPATFEPTPDCSAFHRQLDSNAQLVCTLRYTSRRLHFAS